MAAALTLDDIAILLTGAMREDVAEQRPLILARSEGETDAVWRDERAQTFSGVVNLSGHAE